MFFKDRIDAGKQLAAQIVIFQPENTIVLALPRGGVPLALEISKKHSIPFDVVLAKKIVHPLQTEFAIGALAENGHPILNEDVVIEQEWIDQDAQRVRDEIARRRKLYDQFLTQKSLKGKDIIIVDDGIATGMTLHAAIEAVKHQLPTKLAVAGPTIPKHRYDRLESLVDQTVYVEVPAQFLGAVGACCRSF